ncbi:predicted protein [Thalassiosira pseudonana CCMP1335]|uniref:Uncharacterized protein n=1 Tax=Thalassiosira pseudonana TaxID=35128 RepID=B8BT96_THAPS|nr:predicted protein [Thalassiosira pseudonana CCMP1335]EED94565.1 predicted protein [Thalassiosira pseudonana CCMP1335]|eukprot:scaffold4363_cov227-Alexandrium_tamarense.AAC.4
MATQGKLQASGSKYSCISFTLPTTQWEWLNVMTEKHKLKRDADGVGTSKALRICITCVATGDGGHESTHASVLADATEYSPMTSAGISGEIAVSSKNVELSSEQLSWIDQQDTGTSSLDTVQRVINVCMNMDEYTVFGIVRCKSTIAQCEGAQEALANIQDKYSKKEEDLVVKEHITLQ